MTASDITTPLAKEEIAAVARRLATATTKGDLLRMLAEEAGRYTLADLQVIGGRLFMEVAGLPEPYRSRVRPFFCEQLFGAHHRLLLMYRSGAFRQVGEPIRDRETFEKFCAMIPEGCFTWDEHAERTPFHYAPQHRLFYYLMAAFTMFVLDSPGHPVGMPFPGGFAVEDRNGTFYCLIRDREKEVFFSICNFCPAKQSEENAPVKNAANPFR
ncbi:DUF2115 domain-containing protein [Methanoregula sp.]|uniref:DUF2115 domain-containing protein n=2 Tax=Methanoregula sp. TaxID=2052170 RepID=UPI003BAF4C8F